MDIHRAGVADIFIAPELVKQLLPGEDMVGGGSQEVEKLQLLGWHVYGAPLVEDGIIGQVDGQVRILYAFFIGGGGSGGGGLVAAQYGFDPRNQLL